MQTTVLYHHGIKGQKWGVRRYQNPDGTLTPAGKKRYDRDVRENMAKKKDSRIDTSKPDPNRWAKEDLERTKRVVDSSSDLIKRAKERVDHPKSRSRKRIDLSAMSDQDLRNKINREMLEKQYNQLFGSEASETMSKGRRAVSSTLAVAGGVLTTASTALSLALTIKQLKG